MLNAEDSSVFEDELSDWLNCYAPYVEARIPYQYITMIDNIDRNIVNVLYDKSLYHIARLPYEVHNDSKYRIFVDMMWNDVQFNEHKDILYYLRSNRPISSLLYVVHSYFLLIPYLIHKSSIHYNYPISYDLLSALYSYDYNDPSIGISQRNKYLVIMKSMIVLLFPILHDKSKITRFLTIFPLLYKYHIDNFNFINNLDGDQWDKTVFTITSDSALYSIISNREVSLEHMINIMVSK